MIAGTPGDAMEPLVFALLSALTPPDVERCLYDERLEEIPYDVTADLVALTVDTFSAKRAYQIAAEFRRRGMPVVLGGFHTSLCPSEAMEHADSIVIGDAEDTWPQIISDVRSGSLQPEYKSRYSGFADCDPDRRIFKNKAYAPIRLIEASRGCRFSCDFCSIRAMYQGKVRQRPLTSVLRDIDQARGKLFFFTDDNFFVNPPLLKSLLRELQPRKVRWACQISSDVTKHPGLVSLMAEAGCVSVTVGFESLDRKNLEQMHKSWMGNDYRHIISVFHDAGIMVYGTFVIGYDRDTTETFERTLEFALANRLFLANFNPLTPTPGTPLYSRLQEEERLLFDRWWLHKDYHWGDSVFRPVGMSPEDLTTGCFELRKRFNTARTILARFPGLKFCRTNLYKAGLFVVANIISRRELRRKYGQALASIEPGASRHTT